MCGIAGFQGNYSKGLLDRMNQAIYHRGPDDGGTLYLADKQLGLAHRRLSIIDLSADGHQPMWDVTKIVLIVFNGEIYNYKSHRESLIADGFSFKSHSDTEVLLNLYLRDGDTFLTKLNGIFAFALWDTRTETLLLARDGLGTKPLYYAETEKGFLFASEIKSLLQEPSLGRSLDYKAINNYLSYLWSPAPRTMLKQVKKLEPGHAMIIKNGDVKRSWVFYELPYDQELLDIPAEVAAEQVRECLKESINKQMVADVPVGAFLSGGLDSSAVVALAKQTLSEDQRLQCFTIGFQNDAFQKEGMVEDLPYAKRVADYLGVDLHTIYVGSEMIDQLQRMIYHLDEPQADPAPLNALMISELAREHDIKVLLSGAGGDDIFTGYRRHQALMLERYWGGAPESIRKGLSLGSQKLPKGSPLGRRFSKAFQYAHLNGDNRIASYFLWMQKDSLYDLYSDSFRDNLTAYDDKDPLVESLKNLPLNTPEINKMLYLESKYFLADHNLNYTDKMSMAVGVEVRVPLLDPELVALAARLPIEYKQKGSIGKWIFKKAMESYLPKDVIYRPKTGFGAPIRGWLRNELRPVVEDVLSTDSLNRRGLFNPVSVQRLLAADRQGQVDGTYTIFSLICIEMWCRQFIDQQFPEMKSF